MRQYKLIMADNSPTSLCRPKRLSTISGRFSSSQVYAKQEVRKRLKQISSILKKKENERTEDEVCMLTRLPEVVKTAEKNAQKQLQKKERIQEIEDDPDVLDEKCRELAHLLQSAKNPVIYTGAGISTAASIPDYRGPNGVWTLLKKGHSLCPQDLVDAEPTYTHMCITKLYKERMVKHLVSQNCDGLHLRSGFPRHSLSEVHGNMYIEICKSCRPQKEYIRLFDVTERTAKGRHKTGRTCSKCNGKLQDTIVHFGEKGGLLSPYKWRLATKAASKADVIICLGSSLKVLRCYPCLWRMEKRPKHRPKLVIVNLQWTPKDDVAYLKISGRCDDVMRKVAHHLGITVPSYRREVDPLFRLHTQVKKDEEAVATKKILELPDKKPRSKALSRTKVNEEQLKTSEEMNRQRHSSFSHHEKICLPACLGSIIDKPKPAVKFESSELQPQLDERKPVDNKDCTLKSETGIVPEQSHNMHFKLQNMLLERGLCKGNSLKINGNQLPQFASAIEPNIPCNFSLPYSSSCKCSESSVTFPGIHICSKEIELKEHKSIVSPSCSTSLQSHSSQVGNFLTHQQVTLSSLLFSDDHISADCKPSLTFPSSIQTPSYLMDVGETQKSVIQQLSVLPFPGTLSEIQQDENFENCEHLYMHSSGSDNLIQKSRVLKQLPLEDSFSANSVFLTGKENTTQNKQQTGLPSSSESPGVLTIIVHDEKDLVPQFFLSDTDTQYEHKHSQQQICDLQTFSTHEVNINLHHPSELQTSIPQAGFLPHPSESQITQHAVLCSSIVNSVIQDIPKQKQNLQLSNNLSRYALVCINLEAQESKTESPYMTDVQNSLNLGLKTSDYQHMQSSYTSQGFQTCDSPLKTLLSLPSCVQNPYNQNDDTQIHQELVSQIVMLLPNCQNSPGNLDFPDVMELPYSKSDLTKKPVSVPENPSHSRIVNASCSNDINKHLSEQHSSNAAVKDSPTLPQCSSTLMSWISVYAKLVHNITFDHSYAKTSKQSIHSNSAPHAGKVSSRKAVKLDEELFTLTKEKDYCLTGLLQQPSDPTSALWQQRMVCPGQHYMQSVIPMKSSMLNYLHSPQQKFDIGTGIDQQLKKESGEYVKKSPTGSLNNSKIISNEVTPCLAQETSHSKVKKVISQGHQHAYKGHSDLGLQGNEHLTESLGAQTFKVAKKRNYTSLVSVPGWFGKGLRIKRKKPI